MPAGRRLAPRRILQRAALLAGSFLAAFLLLELGFRAVERVRLASAGELWAVYDAKLGWRLNPKYGDHNAEGLRDRPLGPEDARQDGRLRTLVLGDSVLYYGDSVDDTIVGRLRAELARRRPEGSPRVDVLNAGTKGYTNWQELQFLKERGLALEPDLVGVAFVLNDCPRMLHQFRVADGRIVGQDYDFSDEVLGAQPRLFRLLRKSRFLVWLRHRVSSFEPVSESGYTFEHRPDFAAAWRDESWPAVEAQLGEMVELGLQHGFDVFLAAFPFADQYRPEYLARDRDRVLMPQRKLAEICGRLSIPFLDLFPALDPSVDFESDRIHLSAAGRSKAAARIAEFLEERKLLDR